MSTPRVDREEDLVEALVHERPGRRGRVGRAVQQVLGREHRRQARRPRVVAPERSAPSTIIQNTRAQHTRT